MNSIISEIYYDCIERNKVKTGEKYKTLQQESYAAHEKLASTFNDEQKKLFESYFDADGFMDCEWNKALFEKAFKLGALLAIEIMQ